MQRWFNFEQMERFMKSLVPVLLLTLAAVNANAAITYQVDRTIGDGRVSGFIETNGETGKLGEQVEILSWELTLSAPDVVVGFETINSTDDLMLFDGTAVSATSTELTYDFSSTPDSTYLLFLSKSTSSFWCLESINCSGLDDYSENFSLNIGGDTVDRSVNRRDTTIVFANAAVIPVPAAVWLFASGLIGLTGLARMRR